MQVGAEHPSQESQADIPDAEGGGDQRDEPLALIFAEVAGAKGKLCAGEEEDDPEYRFGQDGKDGLNRAAEAERKQKKNDAEDDRCTSGAGAKGNVPRHSSGTVAHGDATDRCAEQVKNAGGRGQPVLVYWAIGEQTVVFLGGGNNCVPEGERHLR